jgi:hypothetical protein
MPTPEEIYDAEIAPALMAVVERCKEFGFAMVVHVEFAPDETGITQHVPDDASVQMHMTQMAAHSHGNFDKLAINIVRKFPASLEQCVALQPFRPTRL